MTCLRDQPDTSRMVLVKCPVAPWVTCAGQGEIKNISAFCISHSFLYFYSSSVSFKKISCLNGIWNKARLQFRSGLMFYKGIKAS